MASRPPVSTGASFVLAAFTETGPPIYFPGAAFMLAGILMPVSLVALSLELGRQTRAGLHK